MTKFLISLKDSSKWSLKRYWLVKPCEKTAVNKASTTLHSWLSDEFSNVILSTAADNRRVDSIFTVYVGRTDKTKGHTLASSTKKTWMKQGNYIFCL